ncbi:unnamed protein product [Linum tenue]|uniref:Uncharacterized protein n=1 Tax=Linum tenue TaxID=586396 RepID=A0AAV0IGP7_9ROSI|nr:unnamed protein product [Linum tenue]
MHMVHYRSAGCWCCSSCIIRSRLDNRCFLMVGFKSHSKPTTGKRRCKRGSRRRLLRRRAMVGSCSCGYRVKGSISLRGAGCSTLSSTSGISGAGVKLLPPPPPTTAYTLRAISPLMWENSPRLSSGYL